MGHRLQITTGLGEALGQNADRPLRRIIGNEVARQLGGDKPCGCRMTRQHGQCQMRLCLALLLKTIAEEILWPRLMEQVGKQEITAR